MPIDDGDKCVQLTIDSYDRGAIGFRDRFYAKDRAKDQNRDVMLGVAMLVRQLLRNPLRGTVLDLGCGPGEHTHFMSRSAASTVIGVDRSDAMLRLARDSFADIRLARMDIRELGFASESFDAILASFVVNHVPMSHVPRFFREIWRVARPRCVLYIIATEERKGDSRDPADEGDSHLRVSYTLPYTADDLLRYVTQAGFTVPRLPRSTSGRLHLTAIKPPVPDRDGVNHG